MERRIAKKGAGREEVSSNLLSMSHKERFKEFSCSIFFFQTLGKSWLARDVKLICTSKNNNEDQINF